MENTDGLPLIHESGEAGMCELPGWSLAGYFTNQLHAGLPDHRPSLGPVAPFDLDWGQWGT